MLITKDSAQRIVEEMEAILHKNINMMDAHGYIIASTNPARIGQFHGAAQRVIANNLSELIVTLDDEVDGVRKGINLPLRVGEEIVGVIGITGEQGEVKDYGRIIKRMTEILLLDSYIKQQGELEERTKSYFIEEWLFAHPKKDEHTFEVRGKLLGIDVNKPRVVALVYLGSRFDSEQDELVMQQIRERILDLMRGEVGDSGNNIVTSIGPQYIFLFDSSNPTKIKKRMTQLKRKIEASFPVSVFGGVGNVRDSFDTLSESYAQAEKALKVSMSSSECAIRLYDDIDIDMLIDEIPTKIRREFVKKIFGGAQHDEIDDWDAMLDIFFKHNGSINKAASEMYIHKNTLQYRLSKMARKTGYDPRSIKDALLIYLALLIHKGEER